MSIKIPGCAATPEIVEIAGSHHHDAKSEVLDWQLELVDASNRSGTLEFNIQARDADAFFPITVDFRSKSLYYDVPVAAVESVDGGAPISYTFNKALIVDSFVIQ